MDRGRVPLEYIVAPHGGDAALGGDLLCTPGGTGRAPRPLIRTKRPRPAHGSVPRGPPAPDEERLFLALVGWSSWRYRTDGEEGCALRSSARCGEPSQAQREGAARTGRVGPGGGVTYLRERGARFPSLPAEKIEKVREREKGSETGAEERRGARKGEWGGGKAAEMSAEAANGSPESVVSGLDLEETELKLALPGGGSRSAAGAADGERKRGFAETVDLTLGAASRNGERADPMADSAESKASVAVKPPAKAQVVGWPPVRSFRRNALKSTYVKVAVDGAPYLRKVDLELYTGYQQLLAALEEMFSCFTIRGNYPNEVSLVDTVNGTEYVPTYEDKDGDWMLVGDVPWKMFIESCKRLRLMKSTEAVNLAPRTPQRSINNAK
ncbi:hypothetical protein Taro_022081 [Colocasia esculenta]|uniref:Auxin-responsive protein n=1 Tax=Colocasia esculenta TaxID=4460 RepID=A0A843V6V8_COLES|nr:hypothetical protein [Colocasia esculenta]